MITDIRIAGGFDLRTIALLAAAMPEYWDQVPFDTEPVLTPVASTHKTETG